MAKKIFVPIGERETLNQAEMAAWVGVSTDTISKWEVEENLPSIRYGERSVLYKKKDVLAFLDKNYRR